MLNRRHLRVKVLQALYAYHQSDSKDVKYHEKQLLQSIDKVYEMYIWMLSLINEVIQYAANDAAERSNKHLPTAEDLKPNLRILENKFIVTLLENKEYVGAVRKYKISWDFDPELARALFNLLKNSDEYKAYLVKEDDTISTDKDIIKYIFKKVILKSSLAEQVFEDKFIFWPVDRMCYRR
jgi:N utilization substance protein B